MTTCTCKDKVNSRTHRKYRHCPPMPLETQYYCQRQLKRHWMQAQQRSWLVVYDWYLFCFGVIRTILFDSTVHTFVHTRYDMVGVHTNIDSKPLVMWTCLLNKQYGRNRFTLSYLLLTDIINNRTFFLWKIEKNLYRVIKNAYSGSFLIRKWSLCCCHMLLTNIMFIKLWRFRYNRALRRM